MWLGLQNIMLSEISQTENDNTVISHMWILHKCIFKQKQSQRHREQTCCYERERQRGAEQIRDMCLTGTNCYIQERDFPGGLVVKNLPSSAWDVYFIPSQGAKILHEVGQLSPIDITTEPTHRKARVSKTQRRSCIMQVRSCVTQGRSRVMQGRSRETQGVSRMMQGRSRVWQQSAHVL